MLLRLSALLALIAGLVGCDAVTPELDTTAEPAAQKWRHADLLAAPSGAAGGSAGRASLVAVEDSVDLYVSFVDGILSPESASDETFSEQDVRRRGYVRDSNPGVAITVSVLDLDALLAVLEASPLVEWVEPDFSILAPGEDVDYVPLSHDYRGQVWDKPSGTFEGQMLPWNVSLIGGAESSARSGDGAGGVEVDVYVIDSGVDHPDVRVVEEVRLFPASRDPGSSAHGNHVAATIAAVDDGDGMVGVAPGARVHALDVFDGSGSAPMSRLIAAVDYVTAAKKADPSRPVVVNMSVGARTGTSRLNALDEAIQASIRAGVVYVVSAGNQSTDASLVSPAHVPEVVTVGAHDANHVFAVDFSNHGRMVDLLAPGVRVVSAADGGRYARMDGTSMAAPHVAGAAALYLAAHPDADQEAVRSALVGSARNKVALRDPLTTGRTVWVGGL